MFSSPNRSVSLPSLSLSLSLSGSNRPPCQQYSSSYSAPALPRNRSEYSVEQHLITSNSLPTPESNLSSYPFPDSGQMHSYQQSSYSRPPSEIRSHQDCHSTNCSHDHLPGAVKRSYSDIQDNSSQMAAMQRQVHKNKKGKRIKSNPNQRPVFPDGTSVPVVTVSDLKDSILVYFQSLKDPKQKDSGGSSISNPAGGRSSAQVPYITASPVYNSWDEAVTHNPIYTQIDDLTVWCHLCLRTFKLSSKFNIRYVLRHEQSLKHGERLTTLLDNPHPPHTILQHSDFNSFANFMKNQSTSRHPSSDPSLTPPLSNPLSPARQRITTNVSSTTVSQPRKSKCKSATQKLKRQVLESQFEQMIQSPIYKLVDPKTILCIPCVKYLKLDREKSPRTIALHERTYVHSGCVKEWKERQGHKGTEDSHTDVVSSYDYEVNSQNTSLTGDGASQGSDTREEISTDNFEVDQRVQSDDLNGKESDCDAVKYEKMSISFLLS